MITRPRRLLTAGMALLTASLVLTSARGQQPQPRTTPQPITPEVNAVVARAGFNAKAYDTTLSGLVAEELSVQRAWKNEGVTVVPPGDNVAWEAQEIDFRWLADGSRELRADVLMMRSPRGDGWLAFRDVFQVDGKPVRAREERLRNLAGLAADAAVERAARIAAESACYHVGFGLHSVHLPTLPMRILGSPFRERTEFRKVREVQVADLRVWEMAFAERGSPTIVRDGETDIPAAGTFWVDPATGRVLRSAMRLEVKGVTAEMTVTYQRTEDAAAAWAPIEIRETYRSLRQRLERTATYTGIHRFPAATLRTR